LEQLADEVAGHCTARLAGLSDAVSVQRALVDEHARRLEQLESGLRAAPPEVLGTP
jgi:hypothetical protein